MSLKYKFTLITDGFRQPYGLDRNKHGGGVMIFVNEDIVTKNNSLEIWAVKPRFLLIYKNIFIPPCGFNVYMI